MEIAVFCLFILLLILCLSTGLSILYALIGGLFLFSIYALRKGFKPGDIANMCFSGIKTAKNVVFTFMLIGMLTGLWRASGCIATIVCYASKVIYPRLLVLLTFLLCSMVSVLIGTSTGTAATMGVICIGIAKSMGIPIVPVGGAVLAGAYVGDRCSPMSSSALLVADLSGSDIYTNIRNMMRTALVPFLVTCALYYFIGSGYSSAGNASDTTAAFYNEFRILPVCLLPAIAVLIPAFFRVHVRKLMVISILVSIPIALWVQQQSLPDVLKAIIVGFHAKDPALSGLINGGGLTSMLKVACIVCIASSYSGIFKRTGLTHAIDRLIEKLNGRIGTYLTACAVSLPVSAFACNQAFSIILMDQLVTHLEPNPEKRALDLEDSVVLLSVLIPWSTASSVLLATIDAPLKSILWAFYLYLMPLSSILFTIFRRMREKKASASTTAS